MIRFVPILPVINQGRFNGDDFDFWGVLTWGRFDLHPGSLNFMHDIWRESRRFDIEQNQQTHFFNLLFLQHYNFHIGSM